MALLQAIVSDLVCWIETALIFVCNGLISALSLVVAGVVAILPPMPNLPPMPSYVQTALSWLAYIFPLAYAMQLLGVMVSIWLVWVVAAIPLRWAKAVRGNQ